MSLPRLRQAYHRVRYGTVQKTIQGARNVFLYKDIALSSMDYDQYWDHEHSAGFTEDSRIATFQQLIPHGSSIAEIGCGDGTLMQILRDSRQATVKGYDVSAQAVQRCRAKGLDADVRDASSQALDATYDYVIIADCLEHLPEPERLLDALRGTFRKSLLISIPNSCYFRYRFRVLFGKFMVQWVAHPGEHLRYWSIADMRWWLGQLGYEATEARPTWGIPVLKQLWPGMFAQNVVYVIRERSGAARQR